MTISVSIFLIIYILFIVYLSCMIFFQFYHMIRFSFWNKAGHLAVGIYMALIIMCLGISIYFLTTVDWAKTFTIMSTYQMLQ